jgi:hypothetical protein
MVGIRIPHSRVHRRPHSVDVDDVFGERYEHPNDFRSGRKAAGSGTARGCGLIRPGRSRVVLAQIKEDSHCPVVAILCRLYLEHL